MLFYLGTHQTQWIKELDIPLFLSHRRLARRRTFHKAAGPWALDSGGFTELGMYGKWQTSEDEYADAIVRYSEGMGNLQWASPMDWMCEPIMLAKTGLTVQDHQRLTVDNYLRLRGRGLPVVPVLQGWELDDYYRCMFMYIAEGIDLSKEDVVGVGSVCRRQATKEIQYIMEMLAGAGIQLHGYGVKAGGLKGYAKYLKSSDSMAWSFAGRRSAPLPGCVGHINCANCQRFALQWRDNLLASCEDVQ